MGVPAKNYFLTSSHWQLSHMSWAGFEPWQWLDTSNTSLGQSRMAFSTVKTVRLLVFDLPVFADQTSLVN